MKSFFKKLNTKFVVVFISLIIIGAIAGEDETITIEFDYDIYIENNIVYIEGETNLVDGSLLNYEVLNLDNIEDEIFNGYITVEDSSFYKEIDVSNYNEGRIEVWLSLHPHLQPKSIQEKYGEWGENLEGDPIEFKETPWTDKRDGFNEIDIIHILEK